MNEWDTRSFDWPLTQDSIVLEIGAYKGRWASEMCKRYNPKLYAFEPQLWAYNECVEALKPYNNA